MPGAASGVVIVLGIFAIVMAAIQAVLMLFRQAALVILAGVLPLAAAGTLAPGTRAWFRRVTGWMLALIFYKPAAAAVYATAFTMIGKGKDPRTILMGFAMVLLSLLALPALMKFFTWTTGCRGGGGRRRRFPRHHAERRDRGRRLARFGRRIRGRVRRQTRHAWCRRSSARRTAAARGALGPRAAPPPQARTPVPILLPLEVRRPAQDRGRRPPAPCQPVQPDRGTARTGTPAPGAGGAAASAAGAGASSSPAGAEAGAASAARALRQEPLPGLAERGRRACSRRDAGGRRAADAMQPEETED